MISSLVSYTKLSPNHSGRRTHSVDRFTPHCVVGQCSVETICNIFAPVSRQASCNYGIGPDGRICCVVDEDNRSWCTSSSANDQRAITVEVASDNKHPYAFTNEAYRELVNLAVDVCKRYGKTKMVWFGDDKKWKDYEPKKGEMQLTIHRWFANKACPGQWFVDRIPQFVAEVNRRLGTKDETVVKVPEKHTLYRVQVGAYTVKPNANRMEAKLKADGYSTWVVKVGQYWKVQVGAFYVKANAQNLSKELKAKGYDNFIVEQ